VATDPCGAPGGGQPLLRFRDPFGVLLRYLVRQSHRAAQGTCRTVDEFNYVLRMFLKLLII